MMALPLNAMAPTAAMAKPGHMRLACGIEGVCKANRAYEQATGQKAGSVRGSGCTPMCKYAWSLLSPQMRTAAVAKWAVGQ
jgi:hypothetical protein